MTLSEQSNLELLLAIRVIDRNAIDELNALVDKLPPSEKRVAVLAMQPVRDGFDEMEAALREMLVTRWSEPKHDPMLASTDTVEISPSEAPAPWERYRDAPEPPIVVDLNEPVSDDGGDEPTTTRHGFG